MNPHVTVAVMHHPSRADRIPRLLARLGHPDRVHLITDHESAGIWPTARRCWEAAPPESTHHLVIQDDVLICDDLIPTMETVARILPEQVIAPYSNRSATDQERLQGNAWVRLPGVWGQATMLPTPHIPDFLSWVDRHIRPEYKHDDRRVTFWLGATNRSAWAMIPSVVEHDAPSDSLVGHSDRRRTARHFLGEHVSGTRVNWTRGVVGARRIGSARRVPPEFAA